jgi:hypothetical protein
MKRLLALALLPLALLAFAGPAAASGKTYGPSWGRFVASFPSSPTVTRTAPALQASVPAGGQVIAYSVSKSKNLFALGGPLPLPASYLVVVSKVPNQTDVSAYVQQASQLPNVSLQGIKSVPTYRSVFRESNPFNPKSRVTNANAYEGIEAAAKGKDVFLVEVIAKSQSAVTNFLNAFHPV